MSISNSNCHTFHGAKSYLIATLGTLLASALFALPLLLFARNTWELASTDEIVTQQRTHGGLYGTAIHGNTYAYKLSIYKALLPDVVILGTSRMMQIRHGAFRASMLNAAGTADTAQQMEAFANDMLAIHTPRAIIIGIDFWNYNPLRPEDASTAPPSGSNTLSWKQLFKIVELIAVKRIPPDVALEYAFSTRKSTDMLGIAAICDNTGFAADGSRHGMSGIVKMKSFPDFKFSDTLSRVTDGNRRFEPADTIDENRWERLQNLINTFTARGIHVAILLPPLASPVLEAMTTRGDYGILPALHDKIQTLGVPAFDFTSASVAGGTDCEFLDGFHGGDVLYARMLLSIAKQSPDRVATLFDVNALERIIATEHGLAAARPWRLSDEPEPDFLGLGCSKPASPHASAYQ